SPTLSRTLVFSLSPYGPPRDLPSFPTRRSSDLHQRRPDQFRHGTQGVEHQPRATLGNTAEAAGGGDGEEHPQQGCQQGAQGRHGDRKSTRLNSSHVKISYAVFCLKKKKKKKNTH